MAHTLDPRIRQTPALTAIDHALVDLAGTPDGRLIISMPPQEGKSQRTSRWFPSWVLQQNPETRIAITSYELGVARRWGRTIRDDLTQYHDHLRLTVRPDLSAQQEWQLAGHDGGVYSVGVGGPLTGRPVDLLIIDDPIKDRVQADSPTVRDRVWDWWTDVASTRLAPGAPVVLILTRWHHDDLAGRLLAAPDGHLWRVLNIPAQCDDPATDPLGRAPGEYMVSARGRTTAQWDAIKVRVGSKTWASLYQGQPTPGEGAVLKPAWWRHWDAPPYLVRPDGAHIIPDPSGVELVQSWDLAFKGGPSSDYVVGQVWMRRGHEAWLLDQVRGRWDFVETVRQVRLLSARWPQAVAKLVEDKANGPAVITTLQQALGGFIPVQPDGGKVARAEAVTPVIEAGQVRLPPPRLAPWVGDLMQEATVFPAGAHDDQVDALTQAVHRLLVVPVMEGRVVDAGDLLGDDLALGWDEDAY